MNENKTKKRPTLGWPFRQIRKKLIPPYQPETDMATKKEQPMKKTPSFRKLTETQKQALHARLKKGVFYGESKIIAQEMGITLATVSGHMHQLGIKVVSRPATLSSLETPLDNIEMGSLVRVLECTDGHQLQHQNKKGLVSLKSGDNRVFVQLKDNQICLSSQVRLISDEKRVAKVRQANKRSAIKTETTSVKSNRVEANKFYKFATEFAFDHKDEMSYGATALIFDINKNTFYSLISRIKSHKLYLPDYTPEQKETWIKQYRLENHFENVKEAYKPAQLGKLVEVDDRKVLPTPTFKEDIDNTEAIGVEYTETIRSYFFTAPRVSAQVSIDMQSGLISLVDTRTYEPLQMTRNTISETQDVANIVRKAIELTQSLVPAGKQLS